MAVSAYEVQQVRELIQGGMQVYKACQKVGIRLDHWYRHTNGVDRVMCRVKLRRLKRMKKECEKRLEKLTREIQELVGENNEQKD